ncbi:MAG: hypothetical protein H6893_11735 [Brucellaceae bacterium]|nr:hypothetical protein [Brucellaceae bacterium]
MPNERRTIVPAGLQQVYDTWHFAPAVIANGLIFCPASSAPVRTAKSRPGRLRGRERHTRRKNRPRLAAGRGARPQAQFETAFEALEAVLAAADASLADIVELTTYHVDIARHMETFMRAGRTASIRRPIPPGRRSAPAS